MGNETNTVEALLSKWDAGEPIWTVELGGLGPGYEQAIQVAAIEMARANHAIVLPEDMEQRGDAWDRLCSETLRKHDEELGGLSGAMFGAAKWLAYQWSHNGGPDKLVERAKEQGRDTIMVSKSFPQANTDSEATPVAEPDNSKVICPGCAHQFRAIPVQVQQMLIRAGHEPPFTDDAKATGESHG